MDDPVGNSCRDPNGIACIQNALEEKPRKFVTFKTPLVDPVLTKNVSKTSEFLQIK